MWLKNKLTRATLVVTQSLLVIAFALLAHSGATVGATGSLTINGTVTDRNGTGVANVNVTATYVDQTGIVAGPSTTDADGTYTLQVEAGAYDLHFSPPTGSNLNPVVQNSVAVLSDQTVNVQLSPITHVLSGTVTDSTGQPISGLDVYVMTGSDHFVNSDKTDENGQYTVTVPANQYDQIKFGSGNLTQNGYDLADIDLGNANDISVDLSSSDLTQNFKLNLVKLAVVVKTSNGDPAGGATISAAVSGGVTVVNSAGNDYSFDINGAGRSEQADSTGTYTELIPKGATFNGSNSICAYFIDGIHVCNATAFTASNDEMVEIDEPPVHTISGKVIDNSGQPISGVQVSLNNDSGQFVGAANTNASGSYSVTLPAGVYHYVKFATGNDSLGGIDLANLDLGNVGDFTVDLSTANVAQDFTLNLVKLTVTVKDGSGNPAAATVSLGASGGSTNITASSGNYPSLINGAGRSNLTDEDGTYSVILPQGSVFSPNNVCAYFTDNTHVCFASSFTTSADTNIEIDQPVIRTLSGNITDSTGQPIQNLQVSMINGAGQFAGANNTDSSGAYVVSVPAGVYPQVKFATGNDSLGGIDLANLDLGNANDVPVDLSASNVTRDFALDLVKLNVFVKDNAGNAEQNATVSVGSSSGTTTITTGTTSFPFTINSAGRSDLTDINGQFAVWIPAGSIFGSNNICAYFTDGTHTCNTLSTTASTDFTTIFQQGQPAVLTPLPPTNLVAPSPAKQPSLTWDSVAMATSYNVYRDGIEIDSVTTNSYTDPYATDGNHTYYVTAVNAAGQSDPSNSVTVLVDSTLPTITYALSPVANSDGWNNSDVTVTFHCADSGSGVASCTSPATISTEGADQVATGTVTDNAGNTATVDAHVKLDKTAPTITYTLSPAANAAGWNKSNVTVTFTCSDALSGIKNCPDPVTVSTAGVNQMVSGTATDKAGNSATTTATVNIDKTLPTITYSVAPAANTNGWNDTNVVVTFTCSDDVTIASCTTPVTLTNNGSGQTVTGTATDEAGNTKTVTTSAINIDKTAPTISYSVSPAANANGWNNGNVVVTFTCSDALSTIQSCTSPVTVNAESATQTVTGTAVDKAGNTTSVTTAAIKIDKTNPTISYTLSPIPNAAGWNKSNVTVTFTCADALSGVQTCSSPVTISTEGASQTATGTVTDKAGNTATVTATVKLDKTAPTISNPTMSNTLFLLFGGTANIGATTSDGLSGVVGGEYYIDTDPGQGNGAAMTYSAGKITGTATIPNNLSLGQHKLYMRSKDAAGNWSALVSVNFTFV